MCQGRVGGVVALEASRLARNNRDWHHLIDLCALTETLLMDDDGIYDPRQLNDRFVLGMQGSMAAYELGLLRQRAREAFEQKIRRGHVMWEVPVGFVRTEDHRLEKIADRQVQQALDGVFKKFRALGSARQTMLWYRDAQLPLPEVHPGTAGHDILWPLPRGHRMHQMLTNPCYAGALVYGRTAAQTVIEDGRARHRTRRKKPRGAVAYRAAGAAILAPSAGTCFSRTNNAWRLIVRCQQKPPVGLPNGDRRCCSGLLRCGRCGRKLQVVSSGTTGRVPR